MIVVGLFSFRPDAVVWLRMLLAYGNMQPTAVPKARRCDTYVTPAIQCYLPRQLQPGQLLGFRSFGER
jgi:hypothetical protein